MPNTPKGLTYPSSSSPVAVPADIQELATDVDGLIVPNTGGTYTGSVSFTNSPSVPTPTSALHAVNKTYADAINADVTALETELGTNPSGTYSTVKDRLDSYTTGFNTVGNLLTANQASIETDTTGWNTYNNTVARSTAQALYGAASLLVTSTVVGGSSAYTTPGTGGAPVTARVTYTASYMVKAASGTPGMYVEIVWYGPGGAFVASSQGVSEASTASWSIRSVTAVAPAGAAFASVEVKMNAASIGDAVYVDCISVHRGAGGQWQMPGTPIPGGSHIAVNGAYVTSGTVAPEGAITAPPLSRYMQTSGAATATGAMEWVKATGTGSTGWVAGAEADTGWRDVGASITGGWSGSAYLRRVGGVVSVTWVNIAGGSGAFLTLPTGFKPGLSAVTTSFATIKSDLTPGMLYYTAGGATLTAFAGAASDGTGQSVTYQTNDTWPASLPGSAA